MLGRSYRRVSDVNTCRLMLFVAVPTGVSVYGCGGHSNVHPLTEGSMAGIPESFVVLLAVFDSSVFWERSMAVPRLCVAVLFLCFSKDETILAVEVMNTTLSFDLASIKNTAFVCSVFCYINCCLFVMTNSPVSSA